MPRIEPMTILLLTAAPDAPDTVRLVEALRDEGHQLDVRSPGTAAPPWEAADLVHAVGRSACAYVAGQALPVPWMATPPPLSTRPREDDARSEGALRGADSVLVRSSAHRDAVHALGVPWYRMVVVPPGVDTEVYVRLGEHANRTGRLRLVTDTIDGGPALDRVLQAVRTLPDCELVVLAPDDATADRVRDPLDRATAARVVVVAPRSDGERAWWLRSAHLALSVPVVPVPRTWVLEAMACGVPVVATSVDVLEDVVVHGVTGLHVPASDAVSLARAIQSLTVDEFTIESLGMAAADRALSRYAWPRIARDLASAYRRVVDRYDVVEPEDGEVPVDGGGAELDLTDRGPREWSTLR